MNIYDALKQFENNKDLYKGLLDQMVTQLKGLAETEPEKFADIISSIDYYEVFPITENAINDHFDGLTPWEIVGLLPGNALDFNWYYSDENNSELLEKVTDIFTFNGPYSLIGELIECGSLDWVDTNKLHFPYSKYDVLDWGNNNSVIATFKHKEDAELFINMRNETLGAMIYTIRGVK